MRRILELAGHSLHIGLPRDGDGVVVWGHSRYAPRGEAVARRFDKPLIRLEDAFLRSVKPKAMGGQRLGLMLDDLGMHFDAAQPSRLEEILRSHPLDDPILLARARDAIARLQLADLSKYNLHDPALTPDHDDVVLVIDQIRSDASICKAGADAQSFARMLAQAKADHPDAVILLKTHPETAQGLRPGHFSEQDCDQRVRLCSAPLSPWQLLARARAVYCVSSQFGFEAILAGHRPVLFGQPFYAGWGLSHDHQPLARRNRQLGADQLFAGAMILAPLWYDPCRDRLCTLETAIDQLEAETRAYREDRQGYIAGGMRLWKRGHLQAFFGQEKAVRFRPPTAQSAFPAQRDGHLPLIWASGLKRNDPPPPDTIRLEDGFLRSRGLGAALVPPLSLIRDPIGIYYDPRQPSRLEQLITQPVPPSALRRAAALRETILARALSKYNLDGGLPELPSGHRILIPGQVEDDASILTGTQDIRSNLDLIRATRRANPAAVLIYKPHPDVEAGLRKGAVAPDILRDLVQVVAHNASATALIAACDEIWTMTSLMGFEALLRGKAVTCLGMPFYAGWGLTRDMAQIPRRRLYTADGQALPRPSLEQVIHASLIAYPRYYDPIAKLPCPVEVVVERLSAPLQAPRHLRLIAKLQGMVASHAWIWRR